MTKVEGTDDIYEVIPAPGEIADEGTLVNKFALLKDSTAELLGLTYTPVNVDLSTAAEGDVVTLPEGGKMVEFYVAKKDYEAGLNGTGRTLLVRKDAYGLIPFNSSGVNVYAGGELDVWQNSDYKGLFPINLQEAMGTTKFYYTPGNGDNTVTTLERSVFSLSITELGKSNSATNVEGSALPIDLSIANYMGEPVYQWSRTPRVDSITTSAIYYTTAGEPGFATTDRADICYSRPSFTLNSTFSMTFYVNTMTGETADAFHDPLPDDALVALKGLVDAGTKIETGSYVGTGTYGADNPNYLKFSFKPKIVLVWSAINFVEFFSNYITNVNATNLSILPYDRLTIEYTPNLGFGVEGGGGQYTYGTLYARKADDENSIYWYNDGTGIYASGELQKNKASSEYRWMAIY